MKHALSGQTAVVFGASSGVGLATAQLLASHGARIVMTGRDKERLEAVEIEGEATRALVDAGDYPGVEQFFAGVGEIDHLVIPAGATDRGGRFLEQITPASFRATFENKFWAQMNVAHTGARHVKKGGSITFFSGGAAHRALEGMTNVAAVNGAIEAVVGPLAVELAPTRVNAISPGSLATGYWRGVPQDDLDAIFKRIGDGLLAGRVGTAEDIANAVLFLVTTSFVTGAVLQVDGGLRHSRM
jgi:NAD(P)-dependent dehydrogenase (short-subunit alcohol dehydrogenase family)